MTKIQWSIAKLFEIYSLPLIELIDMAHEVHTSNHLLGEVQICNLISVKTGGCPEDCKYCAQSSRYQTPTLAQPLLQFDEVVSMAKRAQESGCTRICLGAAWKEVRDSPQFDSILRMVKAVTEMGIEVCCTLGTLKDHQAKKLKDAGLFAYNHNLDSSEEFYKTIITTRTYHERLNTLEIVEKNHLSLCCGGIIGLGEKVEDRLGLLYTLSQRQTPPESIPINILEAIAGTPLENQPKVTFWEQLKMIALTRIVFPKAIVRLSAGRNSMTDERQLLCFFAGANSIFSGDRLLTVDCPSFEKDRLMFQELGLKIRPSYKNACKLVSHS